MIPKVLVIDDSTMVRAMVKRALSTTYEVVEACDGVDALEKAAAHGPLHLVVCDVNMPRMSGLEFLEEFRKNPAWQKVPAVMLTTEAQPALVERAKSFGAGGWLIKPFKADQLLTTAAQLIKAA